MMKKLGVFIVILACVVAAPMATLAQDGGDSDQVTHAELANMLVNLLALSSYLPAGASAQEQFEILLKNQVAPPDGWVADAVVTKGDLAVVVCKCLRVMGEPVDIDLSNTREAMNYLRQQGIPIDTVGEGLAVVEPIPLPVAQVVFDPTSDPLETRQKFSALDEGVDGADAEFSSSSRVSIALEPVSRVVVQEVVRSVSRPSRPRDRPRPPTFTPFQPNI